MKDHTDAIARIVSEALAVKDFAGRTADELAAIARLDVSIFMRSVFYGGRLHEDEAFCDLLRNLAETVCRRCEETDDPQQLALLCPALFHLTRTGLFKHTEQRRRFDTRLVQSVLDSQAITSGQAMSTAGSYRPLHSALLLLMQQPLTSIIFDSSAPGYRRFDFSIGRELYESTLRRWADTQEADGSWPGVALEEALSRIDIFEADFGSIAGVDNRRIVDTAYAHYAQ